MDGFPGVYLHGSGRAFEPGFELRPRGGAYVADWGVTDFHDALERWRPDGCLAHRDAVFMAGSAEDVELAGGSTDWCLVVEPLGPVSRHDLNWGSEVSCLVSDGKPVDGPEVRDAALAYWSGRPHHGESVWEYLAPAARVLACEPWEDYGLGTPSP